jgi:hypothetical protein
MTPLWTFEELLAATGGTASGHFDVTGVAFDSREIGKGICQRRRWCNRIATCVAPTYTCCRYDAGIGGIGSRIACAY